VRGLITGKETVRCFFQKSFALPLQKGRPTNEQGTVRSAQQQAKPEFRKSRENRETSASECRRVKNANLPREGAVRVRRKGRFFERTGQISSQVLKEGKTKIESKTRRAEYDHTAARQKGPGGKKERHANVKSQPLVHANRKNGGGA